MARELPRIGDPTSLPEYLTVEDFEEWLESYYEEHTHDHDHEIEFPDYDEIFEGIYARLEILEAELAKADETNELLRRILAEVTKQSVQLGEATDVRPTDEDVKEVWQ
jgi:hypothetical protein